MTYFSVIQMEKYNVFEDESLSENRRKISRVTNILRDDTHAINKHWNLYVFEVMRELYPNGIKLHKEKEMTTTTPYTDPVKKAERDINRLLKVLDPTLRERFLKGVDIIMSDMFPKEYQGYVLYLIAQLGDSLGNYEGSELPLRVAILKDQRYGTFPSKGSISLQY